MSTHPATGPTKRRALFHGWIVLAALAFGGFLVYGGGLYTFVLFITPLADEFHWARAATGGIVSAFFAAAPLAIFGGAILKRWGATRLLVAGIVIEAVCVFVLASTNALWQMYILRASMGIGKVLFAVSVPPTLSKWFTRRFPLALGIAWSGWHLGGMILPPLAAIVIQHAGWRTACIVLSGLLLTCAVPPILLAQRYRGPEELGLLPDGIGQLPSANGSPTGPDADEASVARPLRTLLSNGRFRLLLLATILFYTTYGGLLAHQAAIVESAHYSPGFAAGVLSATAAVAAFTGPLSGWLIQRLPALSIAFGIQALLLTGPLALLAALGSTSSALLFVYAAAFGCVIGSADVFFVTLLRRDFQHIGFATAFSTWYCVEIMTLWISPIAVGRLFDATKSYAFSLELVAGSSVVAFALLLVFLRRGHSGRPSIRLPA